MIAFAATCVSIMTLVAENIIILTPNYWRKHLNKLSHDAISSFLNNFVRPQTKVTTYSSINILFYFYTLSRITLNVDSVIFFSQY